MHIFCDFDGTISIKDTADEILSRFAHFSWEMIENDWKKGKIGSAECMSKQIALIQASRAELDAALDTIDIDAHFPEFVRFCESIGAPVTIISDGVDYFIQRILNRHGLGHLPIIANQLNIHSDGRYSLSCPYTFQTCGAAAGVCKCRQINAKNNLRLFIGDGRSDFCSAETADILYAKSALAVYCEQQAIPYIGYANFADVQRSISQTLPDIIQRDDTTQPYAFA